MAKQTIDFNAVDRITFNWQNVTDIIFNGQIIWTDSDSPTPTPTPTSTAAIIDEQLRELYDSFEEGLVNNE
jgi:hypothetical protein